MKLKVTLVNGQNFELAVPEGWDFGQWYNSLKLLNGWHMDKLFVPYHAIASAMMVDDQGLVIKPDNIVVPPGTTKQ